MAKQEQTPTPVSSNPNQTHLIQIIKVFRITRNFQAGVCWSWLELILQSCGPPGIEFETTGCTRVPQIFPQRATAL